jgi:hypothetical protein
MCATMTCVGSWGANESLKTLRLDEKSHDADSGVLGLLVCRLRGSSFSSRVLGTIVGSKTFDELPLETPLHFFK